MDRILRFSLFFALIGTSCSSSLAQGQSPTTRHAASRPITKKLAPKALPPSIPQVSAASIPLHFEENRGQADPRVLYLARGGGYTIFLTPSEAIFALLPGKLEGAQHDAKKSHRRVRQETRGPHKLSVVRMKLAGAKSSPSVLPAEKLPGVVNYFVGRDSTKWRAGIPTYSKVQYLEIYPGIDMVYYGKQTQLEYDFVINPGADPAKIAFAFEGSSGLSLADSGELSIGVGSGKITLQKPAIYQFQNGRRTSVDGKLALRPGGTVGVDVVNYDRTKPLVIDPVLSYSTYLGGTGFDEGDAIAVDQQGSAYVAGDTMSIDFPVIGTPLSSPPTANTISFVSKLSPDGTSLVYSTYLGGTTSDVPFDLAVDANGQAYVAGLTSSSDFPATASAFQSTFTTAASRSAYLSKLSADGSVLLYSTFLGGSVEDEATGVAADNFGTVYVVGYASSSDFPVTSATAFQPTLQSVNGNAFLSRIDTTLSGANSLVYSTFLGGTSPSAFDDLNAGDFGGDAAYDVAIDSNQNAYIVGEASSTDFPLSWNAFQTQGNPHNCAFASRIDTTQGGAAGLIYSTYLCGSDSVFGDYGTGIAIDGDRNIFITGNSGSTDFPSLGGTVNTSSTAKPFVAMLNTNYNGNDSLIYSTRFGGSADDVPLRIATDDRGLAYVSGLTYSTDFPVTPDAAQSAHHNPGSANGFLAIVNPDGSSLAYATYLGGSNGTGDYVLGVAVDPADNIYLTGATAATDFPTTAGSFQASLTGIQNAFVAKLTGIPSPIILSISPATSAAIGSTVTITGQNFGATQGNSVLAFNGVPATAISTWNDTTIVATVPVGAVTGDVVVVVKQIQSPIFPYIIAPAPGTLTIQPGSLNIIVGATQQFTVVDANGVTRTDVQWAVDNSSLASITSGSPSTFTALAAGQVTLTATVQTVSAQAQISIYAPDGSLPPNTVLWSVPIPGNPAIKQIIPAVPNTNDDIDVFAYDSAGYLSAVSKDGVMQWRRPVPGGRLTIGFSNEVFTVALADCFYGMDPIAGSTAVSRHKLQRLDQQTGQMVDLYEFGWQTDHPGGEVFGRCGNGPLVNSAGSDNSGTDTVVPTPDGKLFIQDLTSVSMMDIATNSIQATVNLESSTFVPLSGPTVTYAPYAGKMIVAGDGNAYVVYRYYQQTQLPDTPDSTGMAQWIDTLMALRMSTDGTFAKIQLNQTTSVVEGGVPLYAYLTPSGLYKERESLDDPLMLSVITNADVGATAFTYTFNGPTVTPTQTTLYPVTASAASSGVALDVPSFTPVLQREDGNYVGTDSQNHLVALGPSGLLWQKSVIPNPVDPEAQPLPNYPRYLAEDGSVLTSSVAPQPGAQGILYVVDPTGNVTSQIPDAGLFRSWFGDQYASSVSGSFASITPSISFRLANSFAAIQQTQKAAAGTNHTGNGVSIHEEYYPQLVSCTEQNITGPVQCPGPRELAWNAMKDLFKQLTTDVTCRTSANTNIFTKTAISNSSDTPRGWDPPISVAGFSAYISDHPLFFDGLRSNLDFKIAKCGEITRLNCGDFPGHTIKGEMGDGTTSATTVTPSSPLKIFWRPSFIQPSTPGTYGVGLDPTNNGANIANESRLFHEALHGITGLYDADLQSIFGVTDPSENISYHLRDYVLNFCPTFRNGTP